MPKGTKDIHPSPMIAAEALGIVANAVVAARKAMKAMREGWRKEDPLTERAFVIGNCIGAFMHLATAEGLDPWDLLEEAADRFFREERDAGTATHDSRYRREAPKKEGV